MLTIKLRQISDIFYITECIIPAATFPEVRYTTANIELINGKWEVQIFGLMMFSELNLDKAIELTIKYSLYKESQNVDQTE